VRWHSTSDAPQEVGDVPHQNMDRLGSAPAEDANRAEDGCVTIVGVHDQYILVEATVGATRTRSVHISRCRALTVEILGAVEEVMVESSAALSLVCETARLVCVDTVSVTLVPSTRNANAKVDAGVPAPAVSNTEVTGHEGGEGGEGKGGGEGGSRGRGMCESEVGGREVDSTLIAEERVDSTLITELAGTLAQRVVRLEGAARAFLCIPDDQPMMWRGGQVEVLAAVLTGELDVVAVLPTGSGKTLLMVVVALASLPQFRSVNSPSPVDSGTIERIRIELLRASPELLRRVAATMGIWINRGSDDGDAATGLVGAEEEMAEGRVGGGQAISSVGGVQRGWGGATGAVTVARSAAEGVGGAEEADGAERRHRMAVIVVPLQSIATQTTDRVNAVFPAGPGKAPTAMYVMLTRFGNNKYSATIHIRRRVVITTL
jgi:hypothetical protein